MEDVDLMSPMKLPGQIVGIYLCATYALRE
jgi:hypothetical protein